MMQHEKHTRLLIWMIILAAALVAWWALAEPIATTVPADETAQTTEKPTTQAPVTHTADGKLIVRYYNSGFSPFVSEIKSGNTLRFMNQSGQPLWVTTKNHPTAKQQNFDEFDFGRSISSGEFYDFTATKVGTWGFYNLNNREHLGTIVITQ